MGWTEDVAGYGVRIAIAQKSSTSTNKVEWLARQHVCGRNKHGGLLGSIF